MRKLLSLSLGLLTAASSFAAEKTVTIPAVPDGKKACTFVVKDIPSDLGLEENELFPAHMGLVGKEFTKDTTVSFWISSEETLVCNVSTGKRPSVITRDTSICFNKDINPEVLGQFTPGTYWGQNKFTGNSYVEVNSTCINQVTPDYIVYYDDSIPAPVDQDIIRPIRPDSFNIDPDANPVIPVYVPLRYLFTITDTITGCGASSIAKVIFKDCDAPIQWQNYSGPKEYRGYTNDDCLSYLREDSIMALDPMVNCICPLPLDTIVESTQSNDSTSCAHFLYDVIVKLAARNYADTITAYTVHVSYPALPFDMPEGFVPNNMGNCIFTVPEFIMPEPDCICPSFYYLSDMTPNAGDTITKDTPIIFTFTSVCGDTIMTLTDIILPKLSVNVQAVGDTVYAHDSLPIHSKEIVDITAERWSLNMFTQTYEYGPVPYILDVYRDSIISENKVFGYGIPELYKLDNGNKSADYYYVVTDTVSGCKDSAFVNITVLSIDTTAAPVIPVEISEVKGDVYTITGILVKKDVYLKEVMNDLKDGLYIFNKQKIFVRRR